MKRLIIASLLAVQIMTACGQSNTPQQPVKDTESHDTAWYSNRIGELNSAEDKLIGEYRTITATPVTDEKKARVEQIIASADSLEKIKKDLTLQIVRKFKSTKFPAQFLAGDIAYSFNYDELKEICDEKSGYYNEPQMKMVKFMYTSLEKRRPGLMYKELTMQDTNGKTVNLSEWAGKGKYVLVDFWASWCGPCRQEMPNVVEAYKKFKGDKFEIIGVSFDSNKDSWTSAVKQLGMTWPQMSDLKGWKSAGAATYGINSIPANILLDPQGKIIALDLRGDDLQKELEKVIK